MSSPKLFQALNLISDDEWNSYRKYLLMYTRKDSNNYKCCQILYQHRNKLASPDFDDHVNHKYFPSIKSKSFHNILSRLFGWFEDWLAIDSFRNTKHSKELALIKRYNQLGLFSLANTVAEKTEKDLKNTSNLSLDQNKVLAKLYHSQYYSSNPIKNKKGTNLLSDVCRSFIDSTSEQAIFYLIERYNSNALRNRDYNEVDKALEAITLSSSQTSLSHILQLVLNMIRQPNAEIIGQVLEKLESEEIDKYSDLYLILSIYLRRSAAELWTKGGLDDPWLAMRSYHLSFSATENNKHQKFTAINLFNGVSTIGIMLDFEETAQFINKWVDKVHTSYPTSAEKYCHALNAFRHDKYELLPELLTGLEFDYYHHRVISNAMMIIAQYKLGEEDLTMTLIQNLKKQLKRNDSTLQKLMVIKLTNLLDVIRLLSKSKYDHNVVIDLDNFKPLDNLHSVIQIVYDKFSCSPYQITSKIGIAQFGLT